MCYIHLSTVGVINIAADIVLMCDQASLLGLCIHDYKSLCAAVTICATHTHTLTDRHLTSKLS